jgi:thymidylate synthase
MKLVEAHNVNDAYAQLLKLMHEEGVPVFTRNGGAVTIETPVFLSVHRPWERVLFDPLRNCNPFFHVMEGIWMLAGHNDVEFVAQFNQGMRQYSDNGVTFNAAYGFRWRHHFGYDQISRVCDLLKNNPQDRRCVISMWDAHEDLGGDGLDYPCNTSITCRVVQGCLDFIINNRSNDLVFGLCGANAVHMSMLQEYMATRIGVGVGVWHHLTANLHVYERHYDLVAAYEDTKTLSPYPHTLSLVKDWEQFDTECLALCDGKVGGFKEPFISNVAAPMARAWAHWKAGNEEAAVMECYAIQSADWKVATVHWILRAMEKKNAAAT